MPLDETFMNTSIEGNEPHVNSPDPAERKLARQLRIKRRLEAAAKRRQYAIEEYKGEEEGDVSTPSTPVKKTNLEVQIATSNNAVFDAIDQGIEAVTNVLVAGNAYEVRRREDEAAVREARIQHLETEAEIAKEKFIAITAKWEEISTYIDPLDLYEETENQKEKCNELLGLKDAVIHRLKEELKAADLRFLKDQDKQTAEVNLLVTRINEQIKIMKRIIRNQLTIIENAVETERNEIIEAFNKKWENLNKQRERDQVHNLEEKMLSLDEHHHNMDGIMVEHHELYRSMKISLEMDIQALQQEVEHVKSVCLLNKEKIDYNYQVLKKRDEENLLIKSQQKRRINKLQDIATKLRRRISEMTENSAAEIKRLRAEVIRLHQKIVDIEKKSRRFSSVNEIKYNEVWQFNKERANELLKKIMEMDRVIYEQILGLEWTVPEEYVKFINSEKINELQDKGNMVEEERSLNFEDQKIAEMSLNQRKLQLVRHLLSLIADSAGFLIEDRLQELLLPYTEPQKTLVCLHNIFNALGLKHHQDIQILANVLEPFVHCLTCEKRKSKPMGERKENFPAISSTVSADPSTTEPRRVQNIGILAQITEMVNQQVSMIHSVVNEVTTMRTESSISIQSDESLSITSDLSVDEFMEDNESQSSVDTRIVLSLKSEDDTDNICEGDVCMHVDKEHVHTQDHSHHHRHESDVPSKIESPQRLDGVDSTFDEGKRLPSRIECKNPLHNLTIEPIYVLRALKEFVCQSEFYKSEMPITLKEKLSLQHANEGFKFSEEDVSNYWESYKNLFSQKQEKLWDALLLGINKYHEVLLERHLVNVEVQRLKSQNNDLKRLLQHYTIPNVIKKDVQIFEESEIELPLINHTELSNISMCHLKPMGKKDRNA